MLAVCKKALIPRKLFVVLLYSSARYLSTNPPWKVLFYGSDEFAVTCLKKLHENSGQCTGATRLVEKLDIVCSANAVPISKYAHNTGLELHTWPYDVPFNTYDVGVVVSFGHLIPEKSILAVPYGMINVHASLLPRWRGAAPILHTILNGDCQTGVTIMQVAAKKFDIGKIVMQKDYAIPKGTTTSKLATDLAPLGAELLLECLADLPCKLDEAYPQPTHGITFAPKHTVKMAIIDWKKCDSNMIVNMYNALNETTRLRTTWHGTKVKLMNMVHPSEMEKVCVDNLVPEVNVPMGKCFFHKKRKIVCIKCFNGWVAFCNVLIAGRKTMSALDFFNGFISKCSPDKQCFGS